MAQGTCSVIENGTRCPKPVKARGWCGMHYQRHRAHGDVTVVHPRGWRALPAERFWSKVVKDGPIPDRHPDLGPCWVWTGATNPHGYGQFYPGQRPLILAHRWSWSMHVGREPRQLVLHRCDNPPCVRPSHLFEGSQIDNMRDMAAKGRTSQQRQTHCIRGHEFTEANIYWDALGHRVCRACWRRHYLVYRKAKGKR